MAITQRVAERVWRDEYRGGWNDYGTVEIDGKSYGWWASMDVVWFYDDAEKSGTDTCARFSISHAFNAVP